MSWARVGFWGCPGKGALTQSLSTLVGRRRRDRGANREAALGGSPKRTGLELGVVPSSGCPRQWFISRHFFANCSAKGWGVPGNNGSVVAQVRGRVRRSFSVMLPTYCFHSCKHSWILAEVTSKRAWGKRSLSPASLFRQRRVPAPGLPSSP